MAAEDKPLAYIILGAAHSGRRALLADLIDGGLGEEENAAVFLSETEESSPLDDQLASTTGVELTRWKWADPQTISAEVPDGANRVFIVTDGRGNPIDQLEALKLWLPANGLEMARVICVVDCRLAESHPAVAAWYEACIHFSDVVLLNRREGVANKWMSEFQSRFKSLYYPCLFELVKEAKVQNPALILEPLALRMTHAFDEEQEWTIRDEEGNDLPEEDAPDGDEEVQAAPELDPYFERFNGGRRVKEIPDIAKYLQPGSPM